MRRNVLFCIKMYRNQFGGGALPGHARELTAIPTPLSCIKWFATITRYNANAASTRRRCCSAHQLGDRASYLPHPSESATTTWHHPEPFETWVFCWSLMSVCGLRTVSRYTALTVGVAVCLSVSCCGVGADEAWLWKRYGGRPVSPASRRFNWTASRRSWIQRPAQVAMITFTPLLCRLHWLRTMAVLGKNIWAAWPVIIWEATTAKRHYYRTNQSKIWGAWATFGGPQPKTATGFVRRSGHPSSSPSWCTSASTWTWTGLPGWLPSASRRDSWSTTPAVIVNLISVLDVPTVHSTVGDWAFPVAAARTWNSLPAEVTSSNSLQN